jgi:hypothetical protein
VFVLESVLSSEAVFLGDAREAEWLAGNPPQRMSNDGMSATGMAVMSPAGSSPKFAA